MAFCVLCAGERPCAPVVRAEDFLLSHETFQIVRCGECGMRFTHPAVPESQVGRYYAFPDYGPYRRPQTGGWREWLKRLIRRGQPDGETRIMLSALMTAGCRSVLEIGPGAGEFIRTLHARGFEVEAVELDATCANALRADGIECHTGTLWGAFEDLTKVPYDAVIMRHVFEHIYEPRNTLQALSAKMKVGARLLMTVPDASSGEAQLWGKYWLGWDVPRHVYHYDPATLRRFLPELGFEIISIEQTPYCTGFIESLELFCFGRPAPRRLHRWIYILWKVWAPIHFKLWGSGTIRIVAAKR